MRHSRSFGSHADVCHPSACRAHRRCVRSTSAKSSGVHSLNGLSSRALFAIQIGGRGVPPGVGAVVPPGQRERLPPHAPVSPVPSVFVVARPPLGPAGRALPVAPLSPPPPLSPRR